MLIGADGAYSFKDLAPGKYRLAAVAEGFYANQPRATHQSWRRGPPLETTAEANAALDTQFPKDGGGESPFRNGASGWYPPPSHSVRSSESMIVRVAASSISAAGASA